MRELPPTVIWIDPGQHVGIALLEMETFQAYQIEGLEEFGRWLEENFVLSDGGQGTAIGWESYLVLGPRSAESTVALRVIGVAEYLALKYGAEILPEVPSSARTAISNDVLRRLDCYRPGLPHGMQAMRHLVAWLAREHLLTPDQRKAFTSVLNEGTSE